MIVNDKTVFSKIILLTKIDSIGVTKLEHFDSSIIISGNNLIISNEQINLKEKEDDNDFNIETINKVYDLNTITAYKTYINNNSKK
jgi:hypothetical protein